MKRFEILQNDAVTKAISFIPSKTIEEITFKAPTGSGKTFMMASLMDRVLQSEPDCIFLVSCLSKGDLAKQNYDKFQEYFRNGFFKNINPYLINSDSSKESAPFIPTDYNIYILPVDLYKAKSKLSHGPFINFLHKMTNTKKMGGLEKKIYLIKDECHRETKNINELNDFFKKTFNFSATPDLKKGQVPQVEIKESDAVENHLIKQAEYHDDYDFTLENAFDKYLEIKNSYEDCAKNDPHFGEPVNPCLIVQISNKDKGNAEFEEIKKVLSLPKYENLHWMYVVNNGKDCDSNSIDKKLSVDKWKEDAKRNRSDINIIIFKLCISEGWDIPRACMLYQVRDTKSAILNEQVIGRIRRNPKLLTFDTLKPETQNLLSKAYVWGTTDKTKKQVINVRLKQSDTLDLQENIKLKTTTLKNKTYKSFDIKSFVDGLKEPVTPESIFVLYEKLKHASPELLEKYEEYVTDFASWFRFMNNFDAISKKINAIVSDYSNLEITKDEKGNELEFSFPKNSYFYSSDFTVDLEKWIWERYDKNTEFAFDSKAERLWCDKLKDLCMEENRKTQKRIGKNQYMDMVSTDRVFYFGKNYTVNSQIKYDYFNNEVHQSYPDFIMVDSYN
ncbi:MAG: DEAD/DEAH box helicase family protein, partial [Armatimonadetes bacterium]|nr:DEAD/DEAH box helicase family protein [Candidatus Hippobium faecium]